MRRGITDDGRADGRKKSHPLMSVFAATSREDSGTVCSFVA